MWEKVEVLKVDIVQIHKEVGKSRGTKSRLFSDPYRGEGKSRGTKSRLFSDPYRGEGQVEVLKVDCFQIHTEERGKV